MLNSFSPSQIEALKREAKALGRLRSLSHSHALDQVASQQGYGNWSLLMKNSLVTALPARNTPAFAFNRTPEEMRAAIRNVPEPQYGQPRRSELARMQVRDINALFSSPKNAVDHAVDYMTSLLSVPRFRVSAYCVAYYEMRSWLPYGPHLVGKQNQILVNRDYTPVGDSVDHYADYDQYPHLHMRLNADELRAAGYPGGSQGFYFNDGCPPWASRKDAEKYLDRLRVLQTILRRKP